MAITTLDGLIAAVRQNLTWMKTGTRTLVAGITYSVFDLAGEPGAGALAIGNMAAGIVPVDTDAGYPIIGTFSGGLGYIARVEFSSTVACRLFLYDRVFAAGAYPFNADVTLAAQPSFAGRCPNTDYKGLQLWVEAVTGFTLVPAVQVNYLDQDGNAGDTGSVAAPIALPVGRMYQLPLAAGDSGIYGVGGIVRVRCITASAGTFNICVLRPLWAGRVRVANDGDIHDMLKTGLPQIYDTSALYVIEAADSTAVGLPMMTIQVVSG